MDMPGDDKPKSNTKKAPVRQKTSTMPGMDMPNNKQK